MPGHDTSKWCKLDAPDLHMAHLPGRRALGKLQISHGISSVIRAMHQARWNLHIVLPHGAQRRSCGQALCRGSTSAIGSSPVPLSLLSCSHDHTRSASTNRGLTHRPAQLRMASRLSCGPAFAAFPASSSADGNCTPSSVAMFVACSNQVWAGLARAALVAGATGEDAGSAILWATFADALVSNFFSKSARTKSPSPNDALGGSPNTALATS